MIMLVVRLMMVMMVGLWGRPVSGVKVHNTVLNGPHESLVPLVVIRQSFLVDRFFEAERCDMENPRALDLDERDDTPSSSLLPQRLTLLQHCIKTTVDLFLRNLFVCLSNLLSYRLEGSDTESGQVETA